VKPIVKQSQWYNNCINTGLYIKERSSAHHQPVKLGGLWLAVDGDEERETEESGAGSGNEDEDDRRGLGFEES
jgi:hypothetical protein